MSTSSTHPTAVGGSTMRRGALWFLVGAGIMILTYLLRRASTGFLYSYGPLLPMFAGAYGVVTGIEKMVTGYLTGRRGENPHDRRNILTVALTCSVLVLLTLAGAGFAYRSRAPYWRAIEMINEGGIATARLEQIGESHVNRLGKSPGGIDALAVWKDETTQALPLRPVFEGALEGARFLAETAGDTEKKRAVLDVEFYSLCLEWMDLYAKIQSVFELESMVEPPLPWALEYNDIVGRIQRNRASIGASRDN